MSYKNKIIITALLLLICLPFLICAFTPDSVTVPNIYLKATQLDWNTYYFEPRMDFIDPKDVSFRWDFDDGYYYEGSSFIRTFESGNYRVKLTAVDYYGRYYTHVADLNIHYLALANKWFWGFFYLFILLLIVYYWFAKLIYRANEKAINEEVEAFIEGLDDADFWDSLIKAIKSKK